MGIFPAIDFHVPVADWAFPAITWASSAGRGWINGVGNNQFRPATYITREEFVVGLVRTFSANAPTTNLRPLQFSDTNQISAWARPYVQRAFTAGWVTGFSDGTPGGTFRPHAQLSRGDAITGTTRASGRFIQDPNPLSITWRGNGGTPTPAAWLRVPWQALGPLPLIGNSGHTFSGWFRNGGLLNPNTTMIGNNTVHEAVWQTEWVWPMPTRQGLGRSNITSPFGWRSFSGRNHNGVDIAANTNERVNTMGAGTVIFSGWDAGGGGEVITIRHPNNYTSLYMHLNRRDALVNRQVTAGQQIGGAGTTGSSTGVHLHFEIRNRSGTPINPIEIWHWDDSRSSGTNPNPVFRFQNNAFRFNTSFTWP